MADSKAQPLALYLPPVGSAPVIVICLEETHSLPVTFTKNPVEQGAPVTDHARPEPAAVTLKIMVSKTPVVGAGYVDADSLWQQLQSLQKTPVLIDAITIGGQYTNMGVDLVSRSIDVKSANALAGSLTMHEIRIVRNKFTRIVKAKDPKAQPNRKKGAVLPVVDEKNPQSLADGTAKYGADKLGGSGGVLGGFGDALGKISAGPTP